jgi:hypothetical protein
MDRDIYEITPTKTISAMNAQEPYSVHSSYSGAGQFLYGSHDTASYLWAREAGTNDCLQPWGISQDYQDALKLQRYLDVYGLLFRLPAAESSRLADMMNIRYIIAGDSFEKIYWGGAPKEVKVIERPTALPRALVVTNWETLDNPNTALSRMFSNSFNPSHDAIIESLPGVQAPKPNASANPGGSKASTVTSIRHRWNQVEIDATSAEASSLLLLIETWYPGWKATVDGQSAPIFRANLNFRAVPLGAGAHKVVFSYWPWQFTVGLATSLITFLLLAGLLSFRYWPEIRGAIRSGQIRFQGAAKSA